MNNLRATITGEQQNARQPSGNKEQTACAEVSVIHYGRIENPITARFYMGRSNQASVVYCCLWIRTAKGTHHSGRGSAGGYGYHKASAALQDALTSAGVELYGYPYSGPNHDRDGKPIEDITAMLKAKKRASIGGVGESAMRAALESLTRAAGYRGYLQITGL